MTSTSDPQAEFAFAIFDPAQLPPEDVTSHSSRRPLRRFNVYRNNVFSSLTEVLAAYFPVVARLVGPDYFRILARRYILETPPRSPVLSRMGSEFPSFIASQFNVHELPYLGDVAELEWKQQRAYHAADQTPLTTSDLVDAPLNRIGDIVFHFHPSFDIVRSLYPVVSIWRTNTFDLDVRPLGLSDGCEAAMIIRPALDVHVVPIPPSMHPFVTSLKAGQSLRAAAETCCSEKGFHLQRDLALLIEAGAIAGFSLPDNSSA